MSQNLERLRSIKSFPSLVKYLRDELDWPIESDDVEDLTFEYEAEELGLDAKTAAKIKEIKQLRPFVTGQPWGIFYINFEPKSLPVVALRRILSKLVIKKRASAKGAQQAAWNLNDLLFVSSYGESSERAISFAHFSDESRFGDLATLRVLGWDSQDTPLHLEDVHETLTNKLHWPKDESNTESWRESWSSAFTLRPREVIKTSRTLAVKLADLARVIRERANKVLEIESENGPLTKLYKAFQEALIHDLKPDDFADMYAQTIAYGLLSAHFMRPAGVIADNLVDIVQYNTNPFLKETLSQFLTVGGRNKALDFDELGINEVIQLLRDTNLEAVKLDFGDLRPNEDPAIHFYELFLKEYDPQKRIKRGVFYTPIPVVKFIVRSVDEILRTEFGLEDGLGDITTWGELAKRTDGLKIPSGVRADEPFVQILDPAAGTGTFLVEVIEIIHRTMIEKWQQQGKTKEKIYELWNEYVPRHLLPRLHGFELMMAPYAIAHMKVGLKLRETHYSFLSSERARIYLTNTLEEPKDFSSYFEQMAPALAHEAHAANTVKRQAPITVVVGNPPYSVVSQNSGPWIVSLLESYKRDVRGEKNIQPLSDDYIKFFRLAQHRIETAGTGVVGLISNHTYLSGVLHRGMRKGLLAAFDSISIIDLHGSSLLGLVSPDGDEDQNVFDIQQGVAVALLTRKPSATRTSSQVLHKDLWGTRSTKYKTLITIDLDLEPVSLSPNAPNYFFIPSAEEDDTYTKWWRITDVFEKYAVGFVTGRDESLIAFDAATIEKVVSELADSEVDRATIQSQYKIKDTSGWPVSSRRERMIKEGVDSGKFVRVAYRPFDFRHTYFDAFLQRSRFETFQHLLSPNFAIITSRLIKGERPQHTFIARGPVEKIFLSPKTSNNAFAFPLYLYDVSSKSSRISFGSSDRRTNLSKRFTDTFSGLIGLSFANETEGITETNYGSEQVLQYLYAVLFSPTYRTRYAELLKIDFPRLPLTSDAKLFRRLCALGADLVALHLLEDDYEAASWNVGKDEGEGMKDERRNPLVRLITSFEGTGTAEVAKGHPKYKDGKVYINPSHYFEDVPEGIWNFQVGGYQVCEKWLKDRRGRTLSDEDINHYQRVVVALNETIRLMAEIDRVIEEHGGWPLVGSQDQPKAEAASSLPFV